MDFQEAGNNCGLLHSCGKMCTIEPQIYFFTLWQLKSNNSTSLHPCTSSKINFMSKKVVGFGHFYRLNWFTHAQIVTKGRADNMPEISCISRSMTCTQCYFSNLPDCPKSVRLIGFCDASAKAKAYGLCSSGILQNRRWDTSVCKTYGCLNLCHSSQRQDDNPLRAFVGLAAVKADCQCSSRLTEVTLDPVC